MSLYRFYFLLVLSKLISLWLKDSIICLSILLFFTDLAVIIWTRSSDLMMITMMMKITSLLLWLVVTLTQCLLLMLMMLLKTMRISLRLYLWLRLYCFFNLRLIILSNKSLCVIKVALLKVWLSVKVLTARGKGMVSSIDEILTSWTLVQVKHLIQQLFMVYSRLVEARRDLLGLSGCSI